MAYSSNLPTAEHLQTILRYNPETGDLVWLPRTSRRFNARFAGKSAGYVDAWGYTCIRFRDQMHKAHRVAWVITTGAWPVNQIDHINGNKSDNQWINLREATQSQNSCNVAPRSNNKTGITGVSWDNDRGKWFASICFDGRGLNLGRYDTVEEAISARSVAQIKHHGEFAYGGAKS